ncbi:hypothetical protein C4573_00060 [Candidatus Woesearchaeota archaeon]|nr:MAG: hypothetical protein C4573_00060 [Candidatus Woesearchaeota archaeon]
MLKKKGAPPEIPSPVASQPVPQPAAPAQQAVAQSQVQNVQPVQQTPQETQAPQMNIEALLPVIISKVKEEFKDVANETEKLKQIDAKMTQLTTHFADFKKFMDDSKLQIQDVVAKTEKFDVALYELLTNQFNPFIKQPEKGKITEIENVVPPMPKEADIEKEVEAVLAPQIVSSQKTSFQAPQQARTSFVQPEIRTEKIEKEPIIISDVIKNESETVAIPKQDVVRQSQFLEQASRLTKGVKIDQTPDDVQKKTDTYGQTAEYAQDAKHGDTGETMNKDIIREKIEVEDVLEVPPKGSDSKEVTETISFREIWNDPNAQQLDKTPPKLQRMDLRDLLEKFMKKHNPDKKITEFEHSDPFAQKESALEKEKHELYQITLSDPAAYFWFSNGKSARNIGEFIDVLKSSDEGVYAHHARHDDHHFANWIAGVFHKPLLAALMRECTSKEQLLSLLA